MGEPRVYTLRPSLLSGEVTYRLEGGMLICPDGRKVPLGEIRRIQTYSVPGMHMAFGGGTVGDPFERCVITVRHGRKVAFPSRHSLGPGRFESRWPRYNAFVDQLVTEVADLDSGARFVAGMPMAAWLAWLAIVLAAAAIAVVAVLYLIGLAITRSPDLDQWMLGFFLLVGALPALTFYSLLRDGWPREYDPKGIGRPPVVPRS